MIALAFAPIGMPDAVRRSWFGPVPLSQAHRLSWVFPFLGKHWLWRYGVVRHFVIGLQVAIVAIPSGLVLARYAFGPTLSAWTQIWLSVVYIATMPILVVPMGFLAFALEPNLEIVERRMSDDPKCFHRLLKRALQAPLC